MYQRERMNFQVVTDSCGMCGLRSESAMMKKLEENKMVMTSCFLCGDEQSISQCMTLPYTHHYQLTHHQPVCLPVFI